MVKTKYSPGDLVFGKVKGYPPWPARVTALASKDRYRIFFFGTFETGNLHTDNIWPYNRDNVRNFAVKNMKRQRYSEGMDQIEHNPDLAPVEYEDELAVETAICQKSKQKTKKSEVSKITKETPGTLYYGKKIPEDSLSDVIGVKMSSSIPVSAIKEEVLVETPSRTRSVVKLNFVDEKYIVKMKRTKNMKKKVKKTEEQMKVEELKQKLKWLKIEQKLVDINIAVKTALKLDNPDTDGCIAALDDLDGLPVEPLMLKKQPNIVTTIRRIRKYVGPQSGDQLSVKDKEMRNRAIQDIQTKADFLYNKLLSYFPAQDGDRTSLEQFQLELSQFKEKTSKMKETEFLELIQDPTKTRMRSLS